MKSSVNGRRRNGSRPTEPTSVAVIGCGYWGVNYVRVLGELTDCAVVLACDAREERLREIQHKFPGVGVTTSVDDVLCAPEVDAVVICTEATSHFELASRALDNGKDILVEKPLTTTVVDARELVVRGEALGRVLLVGHTFVYNPGVQKLKTYINDSDIGAVYYLYARRTNLGPIRSDVNASWDLATHDVAIFNHLLDDSPNWVSAVGVNALGNGKLDAAFIALGYGAGVVGHVHVSWAEPNKVREVVVVGSDKRIAFNDLDPLERVRVFDKGVKHASPDRFPGFAEHQLTIRDGDITSPALPVREPLKSVCGHFLHCIRRDEVPLTGGRDGIEVVRVMEAIDRSMALRGAPVEIGDELPDLLRVDGVERSFR
jgi:predicted dehydrogenase